MISQTLCACFMKLHKENDGN